jgi:hypothetical protein
MPSVGAYFVKRFRLHAIILPLPTIKKCIVFYSVQKSDIAVFCSE